MENTAKFQQTFFKQCGVLTVVCGNVMVIGNNFLSSDGNQKKSDFICLHFFFRCNKFLLLSVCL